MPEYMCVNCGYTFVRYNTLQRLCGKCQFNKYTKPRKPIKRMGKVAKAWIDERQQWIEGHPPDYDGKWECYLQIAPLCPKRIDIDQLTLDHVIPKSRHQPTELKPACIFCNGLKGSRTLDKL